MNRNNSKYLKLTPTTSVDISEYKEALDFVFSNNDLCNVALTGPYSSGKTSVLRTYLKERADINSIYISLASFPESSNYAQDGKGGAPEIESKLDEVTQLEGKILNQLVHQIPPENIPFSNFKLRKPASIGQIFLFALLIFLPLICAMYLIGYNNLADHIKGVSVGWLRILLSYLVTSEAFFSVIFFLIISIGLLIFFVVKTQFERPIFKSLKIQDNEIILFEKCDEAYFDKYLDEILYLFKNAQIDAVVFEDLDRYEHTLIFSKLREINYLVNANLKASSHQESNPRLDASLRFFFLLRDDAFLSKDRTKFFDFMIPIVPIADGSNSYDILIQYFTDSGVIDSLDKYFLQGVSLYLDDMRIIKNIHNEFLIYQRRICTTEQNSNKLLAIIIYKNIFPRDFSELQLSQGYVRFLFDNKRPFIEKLNEQIPNKISEIEDKIKKIDAEPHNNLDELAAVFAALPNNCSIRSSSGTSNQLNRGSMSAFDFLNRIKNGNATEYNKILTQLENNTAFKARKELVESKKNGKLKNLRHQVVLLETQRKKNENEFLHNIIKMDATIADDVFTKVPSASTGDKYKWLMDDHYFPLIKYLIRNGYIDETYSDYMTYFYSNTLSLQDKTFLRSITDEQPKEFNFSLKNPPLVLERFNPIYFNSPSVLNFDILSCLLAGGHDRYLVEFLNFIKINHRYDFIWGYVELNASLSVFILKLNEHWDSIIVDWFTQEIDGPYQYAGAFNINEYLLLTFYYSSNLLGQLNKQQCITEYIAGDADFLQVSCPQVGKIINALIHLNVKFKSINYPASNKELAHEVYTNNLYELSKENISLMLEHEYRFPITEDYSTKNLTLIMQQPDQPLVSYVQDNISSYMQLMLEMASSQDIRDDESVVLSVLNNEDLETGIKIEYIGKIETKITKLNDVKNDSLWEAILQAERLAFSSENIIAYFGKVDSFDSSLIDYINRSPELFDFAGLLETWEKAEDFRKKTILCDQLDGKRYDLAVTAVGEPYDNFFAIFQNFDTSPDKFSILLKTKTISFSPQNIAIMRQSRPNHLFEYIIFNIKEYIESAKNKRIPPVPSELLELLGNDDVQDDYKKAIVDIYPTNNIPPEMVASLNDDMLEYVLSLNKMTPSGIQTIIDQYQQRQSDQTKSAIISFCMQHKEITIKLKTSIALEALIEILNTDKLSEGEKNILLSNQVTFLTRSELIKLLNDEMLKIYKPLFGSKARIIIPKQHPNVTLVLNAFKQLEWIRVSFTEAEGNMFLVTAEHLIID